jgi:hypothetical protein
MHSVTAIPIKRDLEGLNRTYVPVNAIHAPVSGALLLGAYSGDFEVLAHVKSVLSIQGRGIDEQYSDAELLVLSTIYRLTGHDITLRNTRTNSRITPYANVNECIPEPASIFFDSKNVDILSPEHNDPREGRTHPMPQLKHVLDHNSISMVIQKPNIEPIVYRSATRPLDVSYMPKRRKRPVLIGKVLPKYTATTSKFRAIGEEEKHRQDFRFDPTKQPPTKPEGKRVTETAATGAEMELPEASIPFSAATASGLENASTVAQNSHAQTSLGQQTSDTTDGLNTITDDKHIQSSPRRESKERKEKQESSLCFQKA